ncbi:hypothetical protein ISN76_10250 [Dyella halodurans]|uniref:Uncharacterized protein n=1 Tax=Dyella halodurans TaxID=1920171 RepID=A0ABV9C3I7_9GAMM|nr:hypothetical protein [Dyella halodurans]
MSELRQVVSEILDGAGVLLPPHRELRVRQGAYAAGQRLLPRALGDADLLKEGARSLDLTEPALTRILGYGWQQAEGLAFLAGTPASLRPQVCHAGALFNLGIVLFDRILDRFSDRAVLLSQYVTPTFLAAHLSEMPPKMKLSGDVAIDALMALIVEFLARSRRLGGDRHGHAALGAQLHAMHLAECESGANLRDHSSPTLAVWRALRRKSALPTATLSRLALLAAPNRGDGRRAATVASARIAGEAIWIADDLADIHEDWVAGNWSRPLWWLARASYDVPRNIEDALRRVVDGGLAEAEARRLALRLFQLREIADDYGSAFVRSFQAIVHAWLEEFPD